MTLPAHRTENVPELRAGDRLTREEFELRYAAMPRVKKAELIEGVVCMPSPVSHTRHSAPHGRLGTWLGLYLTYTPGTDLGNNATVRLDLDNEPQPDLFLRILPAHGGQSRDDGDYVAGAPELTAEITASRASYDLHDKKNAYRRNGVCEYIAWRVDDREVDWFALRNGVYEPLPRGADGIVRSVVFPGLWLEVDALLRSDMEAARKAVERGVATPEHAQFVQRLRRAQGGG